MWKEIKKEWRIILNSKAYLLYIPYIIFCFEYIYTQDTDISDLFYGALMTSGMIAPAFHYMGKHNIHYDNYDRCMLHYAILTRYLYYVFLTIMEYPVGLFFLLFATTPAKGSTTLLEGFCEVIIISFIMGACLLPCYYSRKEEDVAQFMLKFYFILAMVSIFLGITSLLLLGTDDFPISVLNASARHTYDTIGVGVLVISVIAFICSYFISCKKCERRIVLNSEESQ